MYREIYEYALKKNLSLEKNTTMRTIMAYIHLDAVGNFCEVEGFDKKTAIKVNAPDVNNLHGNNTCNPICEKLGRIFPEASPEKEIGKYTTAHNATYGWLWIMNYGAENNSDISVINSFILQTEDNESLRQKVIRDLEKYKIKAGDFISFKIDGRAIEQEKSWKQWFDSYMEKEDSKRFIISGLTGNKVEEVVPANGPAIKVSQTGKGSKVVSFDKDSFQSYGFKNNQNAALGQEEAEKIKAGAEYLLSSAKNHNDNFNIVYWYGDDEADDIVGRTVRGSTISKEDRSDYEYYNLLRQAYLSKDDTTSRKRRKDTVYTIMNYDVPGDGRIRFYNPHKGTYNELYESYDKWIKDTTISVYDGEKKAKYERSIYNVNSIFFTLLKRKDASNRFEQIDKEFGTAKSDILWSIYEKKQLPLMFYRKSISRFSKYMLDKKYIGEAFTALSLIKAYLIRREGDTYGMSELNEANSSPAYALGRVLALVERSQQSANDWKTLNKNVSEKCYKLAMRNPVKAMSLLMDNWFIYLKKIEKRGHKGESSKYDREMGTILAILNENDLPSRFDEYDKGKFIMGYYFEKEALRIKNVSNMDTNSENLEKKDQ